jgi:transposase
VGEQKVHLQHIAIAAALNLLRLDAWVREVPLARTRISRFARLKPAA